MKNYGSGIKIGTEGDGGKKRSRAQTFAHKPEMKILILKPTSYLIVLDQITSK